MTNLLVLPLLIPLVTAVILIFLTRSLQVQRFVSGISILINAGAASALLYRVHREGIQTLYMSGWIPPYGITFVADMLAALLVLTAVIVTGCCLLFAFGTIGEGRERFYFYPFVQFLLAGITGSFLTGDLFNLFVCFEVLLVSSYALLVLGGTGPQLREALKYMLINILSSTLFVAAVAYLYGVTGTLNMAHLSVRVAELQQAGILNVIAVLFLIVFSLKAGLFLFFWLPGSYAAPPAAIMALFGALLTKVGLYAVLRTFTLIFYHEPGITHTLIGWMAGATMILGGIGALAYRDINRIINYNIILSVGFIAFGIAVASGDSLQGVVLYLLHDMVAKALLFILGGSIVYLAGTNKLDQVGGLIRRYPMLGWMLFTVSLAIVGIPPLSGFPGKLLLIRGGLEQGAYVLTAIGVATSLIILFSLVRVFMEIFWGKERTFIEEERQMSRRAALSAVMLLFLIGLMGLGAEWMIILAEQAGDVLSEPALYVEAVLGEE